MTLKLDMQHWVLEYYQICSNDDPGLTLTYFTAYDLKLTTDDRSDKVFLLTSKLCPLWTVCLMRRGCIQVLNHENNCIKSDFKEISLKLTTMVKLIRPFCWHQNFVPWGLSFLASRLYSLKHEIYIYKYIYIYIIRLQSYCFETYNKWVKWQDISVDIKVCPLGAVRPCPVAI